MTQIINKYNDPIITNWELDDKGNKISIQVLNESITVVEGKATLIGLPDQTYRVYIDNMVEVDINEKIESKEQFKVDYRHTGVIYFHPDLEGQRITVNRYYSKGVVYYPSQRVWTKVDEWGNVTETLDEVYDQVQYVYDNIKHLDDSIDLGKAIYNDLTKENIDAKQTNTELNKSISKGRETINDLEQINKEGISTHKALIEENINAKNTTNKLSNTNKKANETNIKLQDNITKGTDLNENLGGLNVDSKQTIEKLKNTKNDAEETNNKLNITKEEATSVDNKLNTTIKEGKTTDKTLNETVTKATDRNDNLDKSINKSIVTKDQLEDENVRAEDNITSLTTLNGESIDKVEELGDTIEYAKGTNIELNKTIDIAEETKEDLIANIIDADLEGINKTIEDLQIKVDNIPDVAHDLAPDSVKEEMNPKDFDYGLTLSSQASISNFPTINDYGVSITLIGHNSNYAQIFITRFGDIWSRRSTVRTEWNGDWYNSKQELNNKADKDKVVTSVNGQTGDITIEGGGGEGIRSSTVVIANYDSHEKSKKGADIVIEEGENASKKINEAIQSLKETGGEVKLMEGNYNLEYGIAVNIDGVHLTGIPNATILVQNENWKDNPYNDGGRSVIDTMSNVDNLKVAISNLHVKSNKVRASVGIYCVGSTTVESCISENNEFIGFYFGGSSTGNNCISRDNDFIGFQCDHTSKITNCIGENNKSQDFHCRGNSIIDNCISKNSGNTGFDVAESSTVSNCVNVGSYETGFHCAGSSTVYNCTSEDSRRYGFYCLESSTVSSCISKRSGTEGFQCLGSSIVDSCISKNSGRNGFYCSWFSTVKNCISESSGRNGFSCPPVFEGVCSFNVLKGDEMNNSSSAPAIVEYNIMQDKAE